MDILKLIGKKYKATIKQNGQLYTFKIYAFNKESAGWRVFDYIYNNDNDNSRISGIRLISVEEIG